VGASGDFTKLSTALASLSGKIIVPGVTVTLSVAAETITETAEISITHPNATNINITGTYYALSLTSVQSVTNTAAGNHPVVLNLSDVSNCAVNDYVKMRGISGTNDFSTLEGLWKI